MLRFSCAALLLFVSGAALAEEGRVLRVVVLDAESGAPIEGVKVHVSIWEMPDAKDYPNADYATDAEGLAEVAIPERLRILRIWPSKPGYVPQFVNFAQGTHQEGELIPNRYEFRLAKGVEIGGVVVDEAGEPIEGARVAVRVDVDEPAWGRDPEPMISTWLKYEGVRTDAEGRWSIDNAPAAREGKDYEFRLKVTHADHVGDNEWGELQREQRVTTTQLRSRVAEIAMPSGARLTGQVVDAAGEPVTDGSLYWDTEVMGQNEDYEVKLDAEGRFETPPLPLGERPVFLVAPGFGPTWQDVDVARDSAPLRFELAPGKTTTIRVVGPNDKPIAGAWVAIERWGGSPENSAGGDRSMLNASGRGKTDENGRYEWSGAPEAAVTYRIGAREYRDQSATLYPGEEEHVVRLGRELVATGLVSDSETGKPVERFRVMPVMVYGNGQRRAWAFGVVDGRDGEYRIRLSRISDRVCPYALRIEADGYRTLVTDEPFPADAGDVEFDARLEPAPPRIGRVLLPDGMPAAQAGVVEATPTLTPHINIGKVSSGAVLPTDADGVFRSAATSEPTLLYVTHDAGWAQRLVEPDEPIGDLQLKAWANVSGRLLQDGEPVAKQRVYLQPLSRQRTGEPRYQGNYQTMTDADGAFEFTRVPPEPCSVRASLGPWEDSPLTSSQSVALDLQAGESRHVELGGGGATVTGRVVATGRDDAPLSKQWSLNYLVSRDRGVEAELPELSFDPSATMEPSWTLDPNFYGWLASRENYFVKLPPDGSFRVVGVPAGEYDLLIRLYEQPAGCLVETVGARVVPVVVSAEDVESGALDVGDVGVSCRAGPRVGEDLRALRVVDATGRERNLGDFDGRHVVMHVWASWCAPCLRSLPDVRATVDRLADKPVAFVGLNIDEDEAAGRAVAEREGYGWAQNYLGVDSDLARQLAISSTPTYYLIGPDGKLAAASVEWVDVRRALENAVEQPAR